MTGTADAVFRVVEDAGEYLWLKEVEGRGKGLQVAVPKRHAAYDGELRGRIEALETGQILDATLHSTNEKNTAWRFERLPDSDNERSAHPPGSKAVEETPADD